MLKKTVLLLVVGLLSVGCDSENTVDAEQVVATDSGGKSDAAWFELEDGTRVPNVEGSYHLVAGTTSKHRNIETGEEETKLTEAHVLATVVQNGADVTLELDFCDLIVPEAGGKKPYFDTGSIRNLSSVIARGTVELQTTESGEEQWGVVMEPGTLVMGAALDGASQQSLPEDSSDPAVVDTDGDGKPGSTMYIEGYPFRIYVGVKASVSFTAGLFADGFYWLGDAEMDIDIVIYGDDIPFVNVAGQVAAMAEETEIVSERSDVTFLRLKGTTTPSCENMVSISHFETDLLEEQPPLGQDLGSGTVEEFVDDDWDDFVLDEELPGDEASESEAGEALDEEPAAE